MSDFALVWHGLGKFRAALLAIDEAIDYEARNAVVELASIMEREAKSNFEGSHRKGQPHVGGDKPNVVTGHLRRSITRDTVKRFSEGYYGTRVYPSTKYARAVELGNPARNSGSYPYFGPAVKVTRARAQAVLQRHFSDAMLRR